MQNNDGADSVARIIAPYPPRDSAVGGRTPHRDSAVGGRTPQHAFERCMADLGCDHSPSKLSSRVLSMLDDDPETLHIMSGMGGYPEDDSNSSSNGMFAAACAAVALELSAAKPYAAALRKHIGGLLEGIWIPERVVTTLMMPAFGSGSALNAGHMGLIDHVFGDLRTWDMGGGGAAVAPKSLCKTNAGLVAVGNRIDRDRVPMLGDDDPVALADRFRMATYGLLDGVLIPGTLFIAGGCPRGVVSGSYDLGRGDVDLWMAGTALKRADQREAVVRTAISKILSNALADPVVRYRDDTYAYQSSSVTVTPGVTTLVMTFSCERGSRITLWHTVTIQFVKRVFDSIMAAVLSFDMDCAKVAWDGSKAYLTRSAMAALWSGVTVVNPWVATTSIRHHKQPSKGMLHVVPEFAGLAEIVGSVAMAKLARTRNSTSKSDVLSGIVRTRTLAGILACNELKLLSGSDNTYCPDPKKSNFRVHGPAGTSVDEVLAVSIGKMALVEGWEIDDPGARMVRGDPSKFFDPVRGQAP